MNSEGSFDLRLGDGRRIFSVSGLNREARQIIETGFGTIWVEGEISNLAQPSSGHMYWSLKDAQAQIRCAMFRQYGRRIGFAPRNGQQVLVRARPSIYETRGDFQLIVDYMEDAGEGLLRRQFEELKAKLAAEGLFDEARKKPLPRMPARIGVITSPTGAAIRDVLTGLKRRFPAAGVIIYPSSVQGEGAAEELASALRLADRRAECDVLILTRGGGSLEDLWAFNEEVLARAISEVEIPVISGVGHETDFTIADFVADLRAPTPSQAAELAVPDQGEWLTRLAQLRVRLSRAARRATERHSERLAALLHRIGRAHPGIVVREREQRLDELEARMQRALQSHLIELRVKLDARAVRVRAQNPRNRIAMQRQRWRELHVRLGLAARQTLARAENRLTVAARGLHSLSPLATLERGYAIVTRARDARVATSVSQLAVGESIGVRLSEGRLSATVDSKEPSGGGDT